MKFLVVVSLPSIYHGCSTLKTLWEGKFTGKQDLFESMNMKNCGRCKVRKDKEIKGSDKCATLNIYEILNISEKFDDLNKMETTSSESKVEENFTGKQDLFESMNMKNCGRRKVRKHKEIKGSDKCVTLNIYEILNIS